MTTPTLQPNEAEIYQLFIEYLSANPVQAQQQEEINEPDDELGAKIIPNRRSDPDLTDRNTIIDTRSNNKDEIKRLFQGGLGSWLAGALR